MRVSLTGLTLASVFALAGCDTRSADDTVPREPVRPAVAGYDPGYVTVATRPVPKYRMAGNTVYVTSGEQPVYVLPYARVQAGSDSAALAQQDQRVEMLLDRLAWKVEQADRAQRAAAPLPASGIQPTRSLEDPAHRPGPDHLGTITLPPPASAPAQAPTQPVQAAAPTAPAPKVSTEPTPTNDDAAQQPRSSEATPATAPAAPKPEEHQAPTPETTPRISPLEMEP